MVKLYYVPLKSLSNVKKYSYVRKWNSKTQRFEMKKFIPKQVEVFSKSEIESLIKNHIKCKGYHKIKQKSGNIAKVDCITKILYDLGLKNVAKNE